MTILDAVRAKLRGDRDLEVRAVKGAGPLAWDPADPKEAAEADVVVVIGPVQFAAVCRLGGTYRYLTGRNDDAPVSTEFPFGEGDSLDAILDGLLAFARHIPEPPPGK